MTFSPRTALPGPTASSACWLSLLSQFRIQRGVWRRAATSTISSVELRGFGDGDVWVIGGGQLQMAFIERYALDEIEIYVMPELIGGGRPLFPPAGVCTRLRLLQTNALDQGCVRLHYAFDHSSGAKVLYRAARSEAQCAELMRHDGCIGVDDRHEFPHGVLASADELAASLQHYWYDCRRSGSNCYRQFAPPR